MTRPDIQLICQMTYGDIDQEPRNQKYDTKRIFLECAV